MKKEEVSIGTWPLPEKPELINLKFRLPSDERFYRLMEEVDKYQNEYCITLEKKIRDLLQKFCESFEGQKNPFCRDEFHKYASLLCKLFKLYQERCCTACCGPKIKEWENLIDRVNLTFQILDPAVLQSGDGFTLEDLGDPMNTFQTNTCQILQEELSDLVYMICKYREEPLCPDNELTRSLKKLCETYPTYRTKCC